MPIQETRSKVKVNVTQGWYALICHPKMHAHTKFVIPTSNNIRYMLWTGRGMDGQTDGLIEVECDYYMPAKVPKGGIKRIVLRFHSQSRPM